MSVPFSFRCDNQYDVGLVARLAATTSFRLRYICRHAGDGLVWASADADDAASVIDDANRLLAKVRGHAVSSRAQMLEMKHEGRATVDTVDLTVPINGNDALLPAAKAAAGAEAVFRFNISAPYVMGYWVFVGIPTRNIMAVLALTNPAGMDSMEHPNALIEMTRGVHSQRYEGMVRV